MKKNVILVDHENVPAPSLAKLADFECEVLIFLGENTTKLARELVIAAQNMGKQARYVQISGTGKNALDFHIAYYLGEYHAQKDETYFHIISKDTGFDPLITHLKSKGYLLSRSPSVESIPLLKNAAVNSPDDRCRLIEQRLRDQPKNRPKLKKTLSSMINSHFQKKLGAEEIDEIVGLLIKGGTIAIEDQKVVYPA